MTLQGTIDIAVHLGNFRGIELTASGLYRLRITITHEANPQAPVCPYDMTKAAVPRRSEKCLLPAVIVPEENAYFSTVFVVRFRDEFVRLNEVVHFRTEIPAKEVFESGMLLISFALQAHALKDPAKNVEMLEGALKYVDSKTEEELEFATLASETLRISSPGLGKHEYYPLFFNEWNCSLTSLVLHVSLLQFTYRPSQSSGDDLDFYSEMASMMFNHLEVLSSQALQSIYNDYVGVVFRSHDQLLAHCRGLTTAVSRHTSGDAEFPLPNRGLMKADLAERLPDVTLETIGKLFIADISEIAGSVLRLKSHLLSLETQFCPAAFQYFERQFRVIMADYLGENVFRDKLQVREAPIVSHVENVGKKHDFIASKQRGSEYFEQIAALPVQSQRDFSKTSIHPILFHEQYYNEAPIDDHMTASPPGGLHLFILVHGFMGNLYDMKNIKDEIAAMHPEAVVISTDSVQGGGMDIDIADLGEKLSRDVLQTIKLYELHRPVERLSFVGHSLGGVVVRAALPHLEALKSRFYTYISLASPHLGYLASKSKMVSAGLWFIKKWKRSRCLRQLSLSDQASYPESFLYRLSHHPGLQWFHFVVLVSSFQDEFVPYESARIEANPGLSKNRMKQAAAEAMARSIVCGLKPEALHRLDVNYLIQGKSIDKMIGRRAHIQQIENSAVIRLMLYCFPGFFA